jgi:2-octaprenylphenol hydroxylase
MHVWDALNGAAIDFDSRSIAAADLGDIIDESALKEALLEQMTHCKTIHLFANTVIKEVRHLDKTIAVLSEDHTWQGQLLMIADGARSPTREHLGVQLTQWAYQQQAIVATVHTEKPHQQTAWQVFNPDGPLAFLPLSDPHQCSIVWSADTQRSDYLSQLSDEAFNQELTLAFAHKLGAVNLLSPRHQYPLCMRHAQQYVGTKWILLGDSAHTIHPLAGLGLNVGLADVALWYQKVKEDKNALSSKKALGAYQRERKSAVWQTILLMEGFKRLFSFSATPISTLRGLGIRACNQLTPLKRLFIEHAAGK